MTSYPTRDAYLRDVLSRILDLTADARKGSAVSLSEVRTLASEAIRVLPETVAFLDDDENVRSMRETAAALGVTEALREALRLLAGAP